MIRLNLAFSYQEYRKRAMAVIQRRYHLRHPNKRKDYVARRLAQNPRYLKDYQLWKWYGVPVGWFDATLKVQGGVCAICGGPETVKNRSIAVDHCHKTGKVRALLCMMCNKGLGNFRDDPALVEKALAYLRSFS